MDTQKQTIAKLNELNHPAQLWIGAADILQTQVHHYLQKLWCSHDTCGSCTTCTHIVQHQHHQLLWLTPEKGYTLDLIDQIAEKMRFSLEDGQSFFIVLAHADTLTVACSNRLLKAIEEPPHGYHFMLLAHRADLILPTIRSRCIIQQWHDPSQTALHEKLCAYFTAKKAASPLEFLAFIESTPISEYQSLHVVDSLLAHWASVYKKAHLKNDAYSLATTDKIIRHLRSSIEHPPMPGSTKLFWKNLFLQMYG